MRCRAVKIRWRLASRRPLQAGLRQIDGNKTGQIAADPNYKRRRPVITRPDGSVVDYYYPGTEFPHVGRAAQPVEDGLGSPSYRILFLAAHRSMRYP